MSEVQVFDSQDVVKNKVYAILAYLGFLVIIPLIVCKDSRYAKFHTNQGLALFLSGIALSIADFIVGIILGICTGLPLVGWIFGIIMLLINVVVSIVSIGLFVLMIIGIINACKGEGKELPLIGHFVILQ